MSKCPTSKQHVFVINNSVRELGPYTTDELSQDAAKSKSAQPTLFHEEIGCKSMRRSLHREEHARRFLER